MPPRRKKAPTAASAAADDVKEVAPLSAEVDDDRMDADNNNNTTNNNKNDDDDDSEAGEDLSDSEDDSDDDMDEDDDSDDDDDDNDIVDTLLDEVMALENKVEASKGKDYGAHAKLLLKLRQAKLKERLEESRVAFDRKFNLSEEQWLSWLDDKTKELYECASGKKRKEMEVRVQELFERATATLPASVPVWLKYLSFSVAKTSEDTEEDRRQFYERSCKIAAKDYKRGDAFWLAYRAFECSQNDDSSQKKNRIQMVSTRALETPLEKLDELKEKIIAGVENRDELGSYTKAYEVGRKRRDLRKAFEDKIEETASKNITTQKSDPKANLRVYRSYIAMEKTLHKREKNKGLNESVQSLYERALLKNPYVVCLWIEYAMEFSSSKIDILHRALRACPSSFELLIEQIDSSADDSDIQTVNVSVITEAFANLLENSSLKSFKVANDVALAFLRAKWKDKKSDDTNNLLSNMHAILVAQFPNRIRIDTEMKLARYWAQRHANPETVWKFFLVENEKIYGDYLEAHLQRARYFESSDPQLANRAYEFAFSKRNKLSRAVKGRVKDDTKLLITRDLCTSWRSFLETSEDSFPSSYEKVKSELHLIDFEKACEPPASAEDIKRMRREGQIARKRNNEQEDGEFAAADDDDKDNATDGEKNKRTKTRDDSKSHIPTSSFVPRSEKPREEVIKELYPDRDQQTAFVKNLDFSITEEELVKFFDIKEEGTVKARVIKDRHTGRSKGIAYVDFASEHDLLAAIMRDGEALKGRALSIAKSRPPPSFPGSGGRGGGRGRGNAPPSSAGRGGLGFVPRAVKQKPKKALADL